MRPRILYIMNVDWDWVMQRPHFLALHLSRSHDVTVMYPYAWRRANLGRNERGGMRLFAFFRLLHPAISSCASLCRVGISMPSLTRQTFRNSLTTCTLMVGCSSIMLSATAIFATSLANA